MDSVTLLEDWFIYEGKQMLMTIKIDRETDDGAGLKVYIGGELIKFKVETDAND